MKKQYQVTLIDNSGKHRPVSCIVNYEQNVTADLSIMDTHRKEIQQMGIQKICNVRRWGKRELVTYGYLKVKVRAYDKEKIAAENAERYEAIKEAKYASGEWQRPKNRVDK